MISLGFRIFEFALDNELIDNVRNPFTGKKKKIPKDTPVNERKPIDDTQKELILSVAHRSQIAALIMLYCGLRKGEVIALEWSDIDKEKIISVTCRSKTVITIKLLRIQKRQRQIHSYSR